MRPKRETIRSNELAYFVSTQTEGSKPFFRHERWARLMVSTLNHYDGTGYKLHAYVVMPDHLHLLISPIDTVEKSVQLIKGGFSFRAKRELEWNGEIWQPGFTDHCIRNEEDWKRHLEYIHQNPVDARLVEDVALYEFIGQPSVEFPQGLKPAYFGASDVRAEARTLQAEVDKALPRWLKLQDSPTASIGAALQAAEKLVNSGEIGGRCPSVAKASFDSVGLMRGLKPPPPSESSFFAACKAGPFQSTTVEEFQKVTRIHATQK